MTHFIRNAIIIGATPMNWGALAVGYKILSWCSTNDLKADWIKISLFFLHFFTSCRRKEDAMSASFRRHDMRSTRPNEIHTRSRLFRRDQPNSSWCWAQSIDHRPWPRQSSMPLSRWGNTGPMLAEAHRKDRDHKWEAPAVSKLFPLRYIAVFMIFMKKKSLNQIEPLKIIQNHWDRDYSFVSPCVGVPTSMGAAEIKVLMWMWTPRPPWTRSIGKMYWGFWRFATDVTPSRHLHCPWVLDMSFIDIHSSLHVVICRSEQGVWQFRLCGVSSHFTSRALIFQIFGHAEVGCTASNSLQSILCGVQPLVSCLKLKPVNLYRSAS